MLKPYGTEEYGNVLEKLFTRESMANILLQQTGARVPWSSVVVVQGVVPSFSYVPASGRATAAEQGR